MLKLCGTVVLMAMVGAGCGGAADFGESVVVPRQKLTPVDDALEAGQSLRLPEHAPFNVADAQRFSSGDAEAESSSQASGTARCRARANAGGRAWTEFQLGQVVTHRSDHPLEAVVMFNVSYDYRVDAGVTATGSSADTAALKVYVMDSDRRVLKRMMLAELDPATGPTTWSGTQSPAFDVTFEPNLAYHLVLAGRVEVAGTEQRSPEAEIAVTSLGIEVTPKS